jgi:two-component system, NarL family, sensor histidine kinase DevS
MPFRTIDDPVKLRRVLEAALLIEADLDLPTLLRHIVEEARSMTNARYGALGVLDAEGTGLAEFITVGLERAEEQQIGARPTGRGILGRLISHPESLRLADLNSHPDSFGIPANHPPMTSFLGVPIRIRDEVYGNLYLTDKIGWSEFTKDDEALIGSLAIAAGIAIENARLHQRVHEVAVYEERDRLARDLHDTVIQRLFAIGLSLQSIAAAPASDSRAERLQRIVADVDETIRQVRTSIFELSQDLRHGVRGSVVELLAELTPVVGFEVRVSFDGPVDTAVSESISEHLLAVIREAVTNIGKHAEATTAAVAVTVEDGHCLLRVVDDGKGIGDGLEQSGGFGLANLRRRAEKLHGRFDLERPAAGGTALIWRVPLTH